MAAASVLGAESVLDTFGFIRLANPIPVLLLLPTVAGLGAAIACENTIRLPLPRPARALAWRAAWAGGWCLLAVMAANAGQLDSGGSDWPAVTRNVVLHGGLGLLAVQVGYPHLAWLPTLGYTAACMLFGGARGGHYSWWAVLLREDVTRAQIASVGALFIAVLLAYVFLPTRGRPVAAVR